MMSKPTVAGLNTKATKVTNRINAKTLVAFVTSVFKKYVRRHSNSHSNSKIE